MDIVAYFLSSHSFFTAETLKAYKSLESYQYVKAGFVREVLSYKIKNNFVVTRKVRDFPEDSYLLNFSKKIIENCRPRFRLGTQSGFFKPNKSEGFPKNYIRNLMKIR